MYTPHRALILLFTHILTNPAAETAQSDLVLMEIAAGFNSRLEFATDGSFSFPFAKEWGVFASAAISRARLARGAYSQAIKPKAWEIMDSLGTDVNADANNPALEEEECAQEVGLLRTYSISFVQPFPLHDFNCPAPLPFANGVVAVVRPGI